MSANIGALRDQDLTAIDRFVDELLSDDGAMACPPIASGQSCIQSYDSGHSISFSGQDVYGRGLMPSSLSGRNAHYSTPVPEATRAWDSSMQYGQPASDQGHDFSYSGSNPGDRERFLSSRLWEAPTRSVDIGKEVIRLVGLDSDFVPQFDYTGRKEDDDQDLTTDSESNDESETSSKQIRYNQIRYNAMHLFDRYKQGEEEKAAKAKAKIEAMSQEERTAFYVTKPAKAKAKIEAMSQEERTAFYVTKAARVKERVKAMSQEQFLDFREKNNRDVRNCRARKKALLENLKILKQKNTGLKREIVCLRSKLNVRLAAVRRAIQSGTCNFK